MPLFFSLARKPFFDFAAKTIKTTVLSTLCISYKPNCNFYHLLIDKKRPIPREDYEVDGNVARNNWLITKLVREGRIYDARKLFDEMPDRDVVTWTALISGYIKSRMMVDARKVFDCADAKKNVVTWTAMISGYVRLNKLFEAEILFNRMPDKNVVSWNTMIDGYAQNGQVDSALDLFQRMGERNVVSWNTVVSALARCGRIEEAMMLFNRMPKRDVISWTAMIAGLSKNGRIDEARLLFERMPERNVVSWNAMITGYAQNLRLDEAFEMFQMMPERDLPSWNTMITGFIQNGDLKRARELFDDMPQKNVVSWTAMIAGYAKDEQSEEALHTFTKMLHVGIVKPNEGTFVSVLGACSNLAGLREGEQVHQIISKTLHQNSAFVVSALIDMYSKCGDLLTSRKIFDDGLTSKRDLISWNCMIAAYAHHGCGKEGIKIFEEMRGLGFKPDDVTYVGLLSACSHSGLIEDGIKYFTELTTNKSIKVREDHYTCLIDLCGRAGRLNEALDFIERLETKPSASVWGALLSGCNVHGNTEIGKAAARKMIELDPKDPGTYMSLSNIYASTGKWREASKVRVQMKENGLKKQPGCSWIEIGNRVQVFIVGEKSHPEFKVINLLLSDLHSNMKKAGYEPKNEFYG